MVTKWSLELYMKENNLLGNVTFISSCLYWVWFQDKTIPAGFSTGSMLWLNVQERFAFQVLTAGNTAFIIAWKLHCHAAVQPWPPWMGTLAITNLCSRWHWVLLLNIGLWRDGWEGFQDSQASGEVQPHHQGHHWRLACQDIWELKLECALNWAHLHRFDYCPK